MKARSVVLGLGLALLVLGMWMVNRATGQPEVGGPPSLSPPPVGSEPPLVRAAPPSVPEPPSVAGTEKVGRETGLPADAGAGATADNPTGRQQPAVSLEWIGPAVAKVGQPVTYQIVVKNIGDTTVHQLVVRNVIPGGITVQATEPHAINEGNLLVWELGTLPPRQEKRLNLKVLPEARGDIACQASVTFTGASIARLRVREPKLTLKASAPEKVLLGDAATLTLTVANPGDGSADQVKLRAMLPEGLEHARGRVVDFEVGNLGPNETRSFQLVCSTKAGGEQKCEAVAIAEGNLTARDQAGFLVILPRIDLEVNGPRLRYLERPASYTFKVMNPGTAPASNVTITEQVPQGFKFVAASDGGRHDFATRSVSWFVGDLPPGQAREVKLDLVAVNVGEHKHKATAVGARGLKADADIVTRVEGLSALLMEAIDLDDPIEVGAPTAYEIRVTNTGSKTETNLKLVCTIPEKMELISAEGANRCPHKVDGKDVVFESLPRLAPRADAVYRIHVRGAAPGDLRFRARITSDGLTEPVLKEESTKVYGDEVAPK